MLAPERDFRTDTRKKFGAIDLFCGPGGLSKGFEMAGFDILYAVDNEKNAVETYKYNNKNTIVENRNIEGVDGYSLKKKFLEKDKSIDLLIGGPPCQGFSLAGSIGRTEAPDQRNHLFKEYARLLREINPKFFVLENVASLLRHRKGETLKMVIEELVKCGFTVDYKVLDAAYFGVPQHRRRIFIIGNKIGRKNPFPDKNNGASLTRNVKEVIGDLPRIESGEEYPLIPNHTAMSHSEEMLLKMSYVKDGGNRTQMPDDLRPKSGDVRKYVRLTSNEPSFCVTGDMRKVFHYEQNRALTVRELARLQTFPDDYVFLGSRISQQQQVGDAVPPLLAEAIGNGIISELKHFAKY